MVTAWLRKLTPRAEQPRALKSLVPTTAARPAWNLPSWRCRSWPAGRNFSNRDRVLRQPCTRRSCGASEPLHLTGQAQTSDMSQSPFATYVCNNTFALFCCSNFMISVQNYASFAGANTTTPTLTFGSKET